MDYSEVLQFTGCNFFRERIVYSLISGRPLKFSDIRSIKSEPGIQEHESKLLELLEKITNGTQIRINDTGTQVAFTPGMITGGSVTVDCGTSRCLSYFLEPLLMLAPFCKHPLCVKLFGVTNAPNELSVDAIRYTWLPVFEKFVLSSDPVDIKIVSRGLKPDGGGQVVLAAPNARNLRPVQCNDSGKVCKIRGVAYVAKVSPSLAHRMIASAKDTLRNYIADVYITVDQRKGMAGGNSPGFGMILTAQTTEGAVYHGEAFSKPKGDKGNPSVPEEVGNEAACHLLDQIYAGGCLDMSGQALAATFMTLGEKDVSTFLFGPLSSYCVYTLRHLKKFFETTFKIDEWSKLKQLSEAQKSGSGEKALMTCVGIGYSNLNKIVL